MITNPVSIASGTVAVAKGLAGAWNWTRGWLNIEPEVLYAGSKGVTASEVADIQAFLREPNTQMIVRLYSMALLYEELPSDHSSLEVFWIAFESVAKRWLSRTKSTWADKIENVWEDLRKSLPEVLPKNAKAALVGYDPFSMFFSFTRESLPTAPQVSSFHQRLFDVIGDLDALSGAERLAREIAESSKSAPNSLFSHLTLDTPIDRSLLYIERELTLAGQDDAVPAAQAIGVHPFRMVLLGNPGAGKTTLVEHLRRKADSNPADWAECTVLLRCREYVGQWWQESILEAIRRSIEADLSVQIPDAATLEACLLTGRVVVVFDGLDEIVNSAQRSEFRDRVLRFMARFPLCSALITTRPLGYPAASLPDEFYAHASLAEFRPDQIDEYARKWFGAMHRPELADPFLREASGVGDLASNPLMLSMLCSLYKVEGYIPANRYDVYEGCANLLFVRWDQHRHIAHPTSQVNYGTRLMMLIGRQFYIHEAAQRGMDERQLKKLLAVYLRDQIGVSDPEAIAGEFLDFCADRAWLLVRLGNHPKYGLRIFGFAHRTFYEYFAARALARSADTDGEIATQVISSYQRDQSSFLPELLIQAADDAREESGARIFRQVAAQKGVQPALMLRLMNAPMAAAVRHEAFESMARYWAQTGASELDVVALAGLHTDACDQLTQTLDGTRHAAGVVRLIDEWSRLVISGRDYLVRGERMERTMRTLLVNYDADIFSGVPKRAMARDYKPDRYYRALPNAPVGQPEVDEERVYSRGLSVAYALHAMKDVVPVDLIGAHEDWNSLSPGVLPALLRTGDSHFLETTSMGLYAIVEHMVDRPLVLPKGLRDVIPRLIEAGLPESLSPISWTDDQLWLAVGLERLIYACKRKDSFLTSLLESHWLIIRRGAVLESKGDGSDAAAAVKAAWNWVLA